MQLSDEPIWLSSSSFSAGAIATGPNWDLVNKRRSPSCNRVDGCVTIKGVLMLVSPKRCVRNSGYPLSRKLRAKARMVNAAHSALQHHRPKLGLGESSGAVHRATEWTDASRSRVFSCWYPQRGVSGILATPLVASIVPRRAWLRAQALQRLAPGAIALSSSGVASGRSISAKLRLARFSISSSSSQSRTRPAQTRASPRQARREHTPACRTDARGRSGRRRSGAHLRAKSCRRLLSSPHPSPTAPPRAPAERGFLPRSARAALRKSHDLMAETDESVSALSQPQRP